jgi:hypothetical protein
MATWARQTALMTISSPLGDDQLIPIYLAVKPQAPHLTGTAVAGSVALAAVRSDVARRDARLRQFLESGRNIATGGLGRLPAETG